MVSKYFLVGAAVCGIYSASLGVAHKDPFALAYGGLAFIGYALWAMVK